jgi:hypothetical protein
MIGIWRTRPYPTGHWLNSTHFSNLESLDWVVDGKGQRLIGNPDHGGEWGVDAF